MFVRNPNPREYCFYVPYFSMEKWLKFILKIGLCASFWICENFGENLLSNMLE
jgi:hypothetical protein